MVLKPKNRWLSLCLSLFLTTIFSVSLFFLLFRSPNTVTAAPATGIIYVDADASSGGADGQAWGTAYPDIQDALATATAGSEIWVAEGVYIPGNLMGDSFDLVSGVALYGGFAATETMRDQRDFIANVTILSGDIDGNDTTVGGIVESPSDQSGDNSFQVVTSNGMTETAILDGFTITGGNAADATPSDRGGGIYNKNSSPTFNNLVIIGNQATSSGGGVFNDNSSPTFNRVSVSNNRGSGAINNFNNSDPILNEVTITGNTGEFGGGLVNHGSDPILNNVLISGNSADEGGGVRNTNGSNPTLINVLISGNRSLFSGGILNNGSDLTLINVTITGNSTTSSSSNVGGGISNSGGSTITMTNSIVWQNSVAGDTDLARSSIYDDGSTANVSYSLIENSGGSDSWDSSIGTDAGSNLDADPLFTTPIDPATAPTSAGDLTLQLASPAIDAGNTLSFTGLTLETDDLNGNERVFNSVIDLGPYEARFYSVEATTAGTGSGSISSDPGGIDCGVTCTARYNVGDIVTLTATAESGAIFSSWSGSVSSSESTISVTMDMVQSITATFEGPYTLTVATAGTASGTVTSDPAGINCGSTCDASFTSGTMVTLTATADNSATFIGWSGSITSAQPEISVTMDMAKSITATFDTGSFSVFLPFAGGLPE